MNGYRYVGISVTGGVVNDGVDPSDSLRKVKSQFSPQEFDANDDDLHIIDSQTGLIVASWDFEAQRWSDERDALDSLRSHLEIGEPLAEEEAETLVAMGLLEEGDCEGVGGCLVVVPEGRKQAVRERLKGTAG